MNRMFAGVFAVVLCLGGVAARAQTAGAKPACAAGDVVVWENTSTKVYHLAGDKYYGNTKHGAYACKSAADSAGYHLAGAKSSSAASETAASHLGKHHHHSTPMASPTPSPAAT